MKRPQGAPTTATLSLLELRRELLRQSAAMGVRAKALRADGQRAAAARLAAESRRLRGVAQSMRRTGTRRRG
jgi:hypothetical protein